MHQSGRSRGPWSAKVSRQLGGEDAPAAAPPKKAPQLLQSGPPERPSSHLLRLGKLGNRGGRTNLTKEHRAGMPPAERR